MKIKPKKYKNFKGKIMGKRKVHTAWLRMAPLIYGWIMSQKLGRQKYSVLRTTIIYKRERFIKKSDECRNDNNLKRQTLEMTDVAVSMCKQQ